MNAKYEFKYYVSVKKNIFYLTTILPVATSLYLGEKNNPYSGFRHASCRPERKRSRMFLDPRPG